MRVYMSLDERCRVDVLDVLGGTVWNGLRVID
jgi:hypothetical protein